MSSHIKKILEKKIPRQEDYTEKKILEILSQYGKEIIDTSFRYARGIVYLQNLHPLVRIHIKKNKRSILEELNKESIHVRDII